MRARFSDIALGTLAVDVCARWLATLLVQIADHCGWLS